MSVSILPFRAQDALDLALQPSQWIEAGIECRALDPDQAAAMEASGPAWTARARDGRVLCCAGIGTMYFDAGSVVENFKRAVVEPMKSAIARTGCSHSGWAMTFASG